MKVIHGCRVCQAGCGLHNPRGQWCTQELCNVAAQYTGRIQCEQLLQLAMRICNEKIKSYTRENNNDLLGR